MTSTCATAMKVDPEYIDLCKKRKNRTYRNKFTTLHVLSIVFEVTRITRESFELMPYNVRSYAHIASKSYPECFRKCRQPFTNHVLNMHYITLVLKSLHWFKIPEPIKYNPLLIRTQPLLLPSLASSLKCADRVMTIAVQLSGINSRPSYHKINNYRPYELTKTSPPPVYRQIFHSKLKVHLSSFHK